MAVSVQPTFVDAAPGNILTIPGSGLTAGDGATVTLGNQGITDPPNLSAASITIPATFNTSSVSVGPFPDGIMSGVLTITASDSTTATINLRARSQYVQAAEYWGEGVNVSGLAPMTPLCVSELDIVLRRASALIDAHMGEGVRLLQRMEQPKYQPPRQEMAPRLYVWRTRGRRVPIISLDQLNFVSAAKLVTTFNTIDIYINSDLTYFEVLAYAIGNYALLGALETIGYSANVFHCTYTSGYGYVPGSFQRTTTMTTNGQTTTTTTTYDYDPYPAEIREATMIVATMMLKRRNLAAMGLGEVKSFEDKGSFETDFRMPPEARVMLRPYTVRAVG